MPMLLKLLHARKHNARLLPKPLQNVPLRKLFHHYLSIPLYIENDANCAALAEYYAGEPRRPQGHGRPFCSMTKMRSL